MRPLPPLGSMRERRDGGSPAPVLLIPNEDLTPLPQEIDPVPGAIRTGKWRMTLVPSVDSDALALPGDPFYNITSLLAFGFENRVYFTGTGGGVLRLDVSDQAGSPRQTGTLSWTGTPTIHVTLDVPTGQVTVESSGVTFGGAWDSVDGNVATKAVLPWVWDATTATNWGGFFGLFGFVGAIVDVQEVP